MSDTIEDLDFRWVRTGWFDQGRKCDEYVKYAVDYIPGEPLPARWTSNNAAHFVRQFGEGPRWSKTASYHTLWISGHPVLRIWTNAKHVTNIEVSQKLKLTLEKEGFSFVPVPEGTLNKRKEFRWRRRLMMKEELRFILEWVKVLYGLDE